MHIERWDLTDETGRPVGRSHLRGDPIPQAMFHIVAGLCAVTADGRVLVSQRAASKDHPLDWEIPSGSVLAGESSVEGAVRELHEEVGLSVSGGSTVLVGRFTEESALFDLYAARITDDATVVLDPAEVADVRWATLDGLDAMVESEMLASPWQPRMRTFRPRLGEIITELSRTH